MKSTSQPNKIKRSRIASAVLCVLLIVCTAFSFAYFTPQRAAFADGATGAVSQVKTSVGVRFVQIAAGEDFAIGLTYDRKIYGWSLLAEANAGKQSPTTLGEYYKTTPTEINVTFRRGPGDTNLQWGDNDANNGYHTALTGDSIASIAATRHTAALVTKRGYIYTWGKDVGTQGNYSERGNGGKNYLLLRPAGEINNTDEKNKTYAWNKPYIIDYNYHASGNNPDWLKAIAPKEMIGGSAGDNVTAIAAGEYNYIFLFQKANHDYRTLVWGSLLYSVPNVQPASSFTYADSIARSEITLRVYQTGFANMPSVVAGGYTVGINGNAAKTPETVGSETVAAGTSLLIHGKNFSTAQDGTLAGNNYTITQTTEVVTPARNIVDTTQGTGSAVGDIKYTQNSVTYTIKDAIAGVQGDIKAENELRGYDTERYYARQKGSLVYSSTAATALKDADDNALEDSAGALLPVRYSVSLGNEVGYGISSGNLYAWGDNSKNQLSNTISGSQINPTQISGLSNIVSVAAGKQKSGASIAFYDTDTLVFGETATTFNNAVKKDEAFITGALKGDGTLSVWGNDGAITSLSSFGKDTGNTEKFTAVFSGYGNHLFAITERGKAVLITKDTSGYTQKVYDDFNDTDGTKVENWEVETPNNIVFTVPASETPEVSPDLGSATVYVWGVQKNGGDIKINATYNVTNDTYTESAYKNLVKTNNIGDAYRIIGIIDADANIKFNRDGVANLSNTKGDTTYYEPRFYFKPKGSTTEYPMTDKQRENMFGVDFVYDTTNGVGIKITPHMSSKSGTITGKFYIARYNSYKNITGAYDKTGSPATDTYADNAIYYDYKECTITFEIKDTPSVITFQNFGDNGTGNCNIPLLDPNNEYNKFYSVAVQNVSAGVDELIKFITGETTVDTTVKGAVLTAMRDTTKGDKGIHDGDKGFPDSSKIANGNLNYYLGAAAASAAYNDTYQYLFTDRDGDRVVVALPRGRNIFSETTVAGKIIEKKVDIELSTLSSAFNGKSEAEITKAISTDFKNVYGLYNVSVAAQQGKKRLVFSYDVIELEAIDSTGQLEYEATHNITDYKTVADSFAGKAGSISAKTIVEYSYVNTGDKAGYNEVINSAIEVGVSLDEIIKIFASPSLRIKKNYFGTNSADLINIYGDSAAVNNATSRTGNKLTIEINRVVEVGSEYQIPLDDFFAKSTPAMSFTHKGLSNASAWSDFEKQFIDETGSSNGINSDAVKVVSLSRNEIKVRPKTNAPIEFEIELQRFIDINKREIQFNAPTADVNNPIADEKIYLTFKFTNIKGFKFEKAANLTTEYSVTKQSVISLFGERINSSDNVLNNGSPLVTIMREDGVNIGTFSTLKNATKIFGVQSSEDGKADSAKIFTVAPAANASDAASDKKALIITPKYSGSGKIRFAASVYGQTLSFEYTVNVSYVTVLDETISIKSDRYLDVQTLTMALQKANSFNQNIGNFKVLYSDPQAISFKTADGKVEIPKFVRDVVFEGLSAGGTPTIRIKSNDVATQGSDNTYYMYVKYTDAAVATYEAALAQGSAVIEVAVPIKSGKVILSDTETGDALTVAIDCRNPNKDGDKHTWWAATGQKLTTSVEINLEKLLNLINVEGAARQKVFLIQAEDGAAAYFNYATGSADKSIIITPIDNTPKEKEERKAYALNIFVYEEGNDKNDTTVYSINVSVDGIVTTLPLTTQDGVIGYVNVWLYSFAIVFGVLAIIFVVRFVLYMKKRSKQRAIIKRNQELIRMRDRMHNKATAATREQVVRTKLKMEDPKYAKLFNEMRKNKEEESGVILENSDLAATAAKKTKKKKGGKKSVSDLKAELEAKKAAFAAAQSQNAQPVNPFVNEVPIEGVDFGGGGYDAGGYAEGGGFNDAPNAFEAQGMDGIVFDASDSSDGM